MNKLIGSKLVTGKIVRMQAWKEHKEWTTFSIDTATHYVPIRIATDDTSNGTDDIIRNFSFNNQSYY